MRKWSECNGLGKLCIVCCCINIYFAFTLGSMGDYQAVINGVSAFLCALGSFSNKCKK